VSAETARFGPSRPDVSTHRWRIDEREYARHEERRGRRFAYESIDPHRTALVVVDMIPFFVAANPYCRGVIGTINALSSALRAAGGLTAWIVPAAEVEPSAWASEFYGSEVATQYAASGRTCDARRRLDHNLDVDDRDIVVEKRSASAFFPGLSPLPERLSDRGVTTVAIAGTVTNVCCESSARDASALGHRVIMVADACAATDDDAHNATLRTVYRSFGDVRPTAELVAMIAAGSCGDTRSGRGRTR
jgi:nicotinamidase-related amidase